MTFKEKALYHQIHPIKLSTDWLIGGLLAYYLLWSHYLLAGLLVSIIPSIIASYIIIRYVGLEKYKRSAFGIYVKRYMTGLMQTIRLSGAAIAGLGSWYHSPITIILGICIILFGWLKGLIQLQ